MKVDDDLRDILFEPSPLAGTDLSALRGRVAVGMPLGKDGPPPTAYVSWSRLLLGMERVIGNIALCEAWRMPVTASRTCLVMEFLKSDCEWLLSLDYDMVFEPVVPLHLLVDVLQHPEIQFVSGTARKAGPPYDPAIYSRVGSEWKSVRAWPKQGLFTADRVGLFGFVAHRSAFEAIPQPWFGGMDECWYFCDKARAAGVTLWVDPKAAFGHIGERVVSGDPDRYEEESNEN